MVSYRDVDSLGLSGAGWGRPIDRFVAQLGPEAVNDLSAILEQLQVLDRQYWTRPQFDLLHGHHGIGEIRFNGENKTYRLFGFFGPVRNQFTFLLGCEKKRHLRDEIDNAAKRRKFAESKQELLYAFRI